MTRGGDPRGPRNQSVVDAARLQRSRHRRERSQTLIEGPQILTEALVAGVAVESAFASSSDDETFDLGERHGFDVVPVDDAALARLADTKSPRGPVAIIPIPGDETHHTGNLLVAHGVSDPGNLGALIRTAAAFGWGVGITPGSADPWSPKTMRGAMGGHFRTKLIRLDDLGDLTAWTTVATVVDGGMPPSDVSSGPYAVLVGEEATGLPADVVDECDIQVTIPMPGGTESLNAGVAAGIVVYELSLR
jgi:TrmH family RNA methyltransferase